MLIIGVTTAHNGRITVPENSVVPLEETAAATVPAAKVTTHVVAEGENLSSIAAQYNIDVDTIVAANPNLPDVIQPGDKVTVLPQKGLVYTVCEGDTLWNIAETYGVEVAAIMNANGKSDELVNINEKLFIPGAKPVKTAVSRGSVKRFSWPATGEITSPFGYRWGRLHAGIDIADDEGTPVRAAMAGRVEDTGWVSGYGNTVMIQHGDGFSTLYGHLAGYAVSPGQYVEAGEVIAYMGNTGNSTGPHLHFEIHKNGRLVNPVTLLP